jgi:hypothetical protein
MRHRKPKEMSQEEIELEIHVNADRQTMNKFYESMSTTGITPERKQLYREKFEQLSSRIRELQVLTRK